MRALDDDLLGEAPAPSERYCRAKRSVLTRAKWDAMRERGGDDVPSFELVGFERVEAVLAALGGSDIDPTAPASGHADCPGRLQGQLGLGTLIGRLSDLVLNSADADAKRVTVRRRKPKKF